MATRANYTCLFLNACLGCLNLTVGGCSGGKGEVSGLVKFKGEPLPNGRVTFVCQTGAKEVLSDEIVNGRYTISGIPVGPVTIVVETFPPPAATIPPIKIPGGMPPNIKGMPEPGAAHPVPGKYVAIPSRYGNLEQSGLSYTVTVGQQEHDIPLQP
jgi:hypothetical protein